jgi:hypothetical protein
MRSTKILWTCLKEISGLRRHRHRVDAANILEEVDQRIQKCRPPRGIVPDPRIPPYERDLFVQAPFPVSPPTVMDVYQLMAARTNQEPIPLPQMPNGAIPSRSANILLPEQNALLCRFFRTSPRQALAIHEAIKVIVNADTLDSGIVVPLFFDDPAERALPYSEDFPLLITPAPKIGVNKTMVKRPEITDTRRGHVLTEHKNSYIYKLICRVQDAVVMPAIAAKYVIVLRATRGRFLNPSLDEIEKEPPATEQEVKAVISWFALNFPKVIIKKLPDSTTYASHNRKDSPSSIDLNTVHLDQIERLQRGGRPVAHRLYVIYVVLFHELAHYLNTVVNSPARPTLFVTPRKLRYLVSASGTEEDSNHPAYNPINKYYGEMGQFVEFMIFGHIVDLHSQQDFLQVVTWTSFPGPSLTNTPMITIDPYAATRLLSSVPPTRMNATQLRRFLRDCQLKRAKEELAGEPIELDDIEDGGMDDSDDEGMELDDIEDGTGNDKGSIGDGEADASSTNGGWDSGLFMASDENDPYE